MESERTLGDLDQLEEIEDGLALVRHVGTTDDEDQTPFRVLQDVLHDMWTVVAGDFLTPRQVLQVCAYMPLDVVLYHQHEQGCEVHMTWLERKDAVVCGPSTIAL